MDYMAPVEIGAPSTEQVEIVAEIMPGGVECPIVRTADGAVYSVVALPRGVEVGDRLHIVGKIRAFSYCMQGRTIRAQAVDILERSHSGKPARR